MTFLAGTLLGAITTVAAAWLLSGLLSPLPKAVRLSTIAVLGAIAWLAKEGPLRGRISLPENRRLIPAEVFTGSALRGAWRFGFELGTGVRTFVPSPAPYLAALLLLLGWLRLGDALMIAVGFGFARAMPLMLQLSEAGRNGTTEIFLTQRGRFAPHLASAMVAIAGVSLAG